MNCPLCGRQETSFNFNTRRREPVNHPEGVTEIICLSCLQMILSSGQDKLKEAYQKALEAGEPGKAKALEQFIRGDLGETEKQSETKERPIVGKAGESNRSMDGKGVMRKTRASYHQLRPERTTRQLDERRVAIR